MFAMMGGAKPSSRYDEYESGGPGTSQPTQDCMASCDLGFYDSEAPQTSYEKSRERVHAGNGLIIVAWNARGYRLGEVLYRILDTMNHRTGLIVEASRMVGSVRGREGHACSGPPDTCLLHLCKRSPCPYVGKNDGTIAHVTEWKAFSPGALCEPWVELGTIERLMRPYVGPRSTLLQDLAASAYSWRDYSSELRAYIPKPLIPGECKNHHRLSERAITAVKKGSRKWILAKLWGTYVNSRIRYAQSLKGKAKGKGKDWGKPAE